MYVLFSVFRSSPAGRTQRTYFYQLISGFAVAFQPVNLFYCFIGCLIGTLVGVLPGIGPTAAMALLLPATFHVAPVSADHHARRASTTGRTYGGSTTSILVNIPGEAASVVTCLDGYQMAKQGQGRAPWASPPSAPSSPAPSAWSA